MLSYGEQIIKGLDDMLKDKLEIRCGIEKLPPYEVFFRVYQYDGFTKSKKYASPEKALVALGSVGFEKE